MKKYDLLSKRSLDDKKMIVPHLASNGLASPMRTFYLLTEVWILSSDVTPQPLGTVGIWDDTETWQDLNVWYD